MNYLFIIFFYIKSQIFYVLSYVFALFSGLVGIACSIIAIHRFFLNEFLYLLQKMKKTYVSFLENVFNAQYFLIQDSLSIASLILIISKICFGQFHFILNFSLFILLFLTSLFLFLSENFKSLLYTLFFKGLSPYYTMVETYSPHEKSWKELTDFFMEPNYGSAPLEDNLKKYYIPPKIYFYNYLFLYLLHFFIFIRLCFFSEPFICISIKLLFCYMLFFNKLSFFSYLLSIIVIISKFIFFLHLDNFTQFKSIWAHKHEYFYANNVMIYPSFSNTQVISAFIISMLFSKEYKKENSKDVLLARNKNEWYLIAEKFKNSLKSHENILFYLPYDFDFVLENLNHGSAHALSYNKEYFSVYKQNTILISLIKFVLFLFFFPFLFKYSLFFFDNSILLNSPFFLLTTNGRNLFKNLYGNLFGKDYFEHRIYITFKDNTLYFYNETTIKPNLNHPLHFNIQIENCDVSSIVAIGNKVNITEEFYEDLIQNYVEKQPNIVIPFLNKLDESVFINRNLEFLNAFSKNDPDTYKIMQSYINLTRGPAVHLYNGFKPFILCDFDDYDCKKERSEVKKIIENKLITCPDEPPKTKAFMKEVLKEYALIEQNSKNIHSLWNQTVNDSRQINNYVIQQMGDAFSTHKRFKDAAKACDFDLTDSIFNKGIILQKTHKSLSNDLILNNHHLHYKKRELLGEDRQNKLNISKNKHINIDIEDS